MKKRIIVLILGASLIFSPSLFALSLMTEAEMRAAIGQAGVSIVFEHIYFEQTAGSMTYTDDDGTTGTPGSVVISDTHIIKTYDALISSADYIDKFQEATNGVTPLTAWKKFSPLTLDVGACATLSAIYQDTMGLGPSLTVAGIVAGLPTLLINTSAEKYDIAVSMVGAANDGSTFLRVQKEGSVMAILGGTIEIAAH